ncbi:hypothetical protein KSF_089800 [Reticulibacter mediterranei]|uniref:Uncharacterized protein n=1 Tax=Reticulibacter mediterranei TaxID=2778369 RepID=A0A8J3N558_9CHLR|nr:hypothetical protein KSF_089800 [Reticulibacter mediterranei]
MLFDLAMAQLIDRKVLLPGVCVLEHLVSSVCEHASVRLWQRLAQFWMLGYQFSPRFAELREARFWK